jgi:hypothetical protein
MIFLPSIWAHIFNGILFLISIVIAYVYFPKIIKLDPYRKIVLVLLFSIAIGIHSISHLGLEVFYSY